MANNSRLHRVTWDLAICAASMCASFGNGDTVAMTADFVQLNVSNPTSYTKKYVVDSGLLMITGEYTFVPNPCTTEPCLPGMIFALKVREVYYYLTLEGQWIWEAQSWNGFAPQVGQMVRVLGEINEAVNTAGHVFYNFEILSLKPKR